MNGIVGFFALSCNFFVSKKLFQNEKFQDILNQIFQLFCSQAMLLYFPICRKKVLSKYFVENIFSF